MAEITSTLGSFAAAAPSAASASHRSGPLGEPAPGPVEDGPGAASDRLDMQQQEMQADGGPGHPGRAKGPGRAPSSKHHGPREAGKNHPQWAPHRPAPAPKPPKDGDEAPREAAEPPDQPCHNGCPPHGAKAICGRRPRMEDAYTAIPFLMEVPVPANRLAQPDILPPRIATQVKSASNSSASDGEGPGEATGAAGSAPEGNDAGRADSGLSASTAGEPAPLPFMETLHFFGVFDGHGGAEAALHCAQTLHQRIAEALSAATTSPQPSTDHPLDPLVGSGEESRAIAAVTDTAAAATTSGPESIAASGPPCQCKGQCAHAAVGAARGGGETPLVALGPDGKLSHPDGSAQHGDDSDSATSDAENFMEVLPVGLRPGSRVGAVGSSACPTRFRSLPMYCMLKTGFGRASVVQGVRHGA